MCWSIFLTELQTWRPAIFFKDCKHRCFPVNIGNIPFPSVENPVWDLAAIWSKYFFLKVDTSYSRLKKICPTRFLITFLVLHYINPLHANVALIYKPVNWFAVGNIDEGNTGIWWVKHSLCILLKNFHCHDLHQQKFPW